MAGQKKRILLVGSYSFDGSESMQRYGGMLERALADRGYRVRLVTPPRIAGRLRSRARGLGKWFGYIDKYLFFPWQLRARAREADIVHICDQGTASYARGLRRSPIVITCHDIFAIRAGMGAMPAHTLTVTGKILQRMNRRGLELADAVVCVSEHTRDELLQFTSCDPETVTVANNPLNYPYRPADREEIAAVLSRVGVDVRQRYFFHISGNYPYKNRTGVVGIFNELRNLEPYRDTKLILAGHPWPQELSELVTALGLTGYVVSVVSPSNEDLRALYSGALALIFPSLYEGFGWPLLEAQACECPVATSDRRPMSDIVRDSAILFDPLNHRDAAVRIANGLVNADALKERGLANVERFSPDAMVSELERAYSAAVERKRSSGEN